MINTDGEFPVAGLRGDACSQAARGTFGRPAIVYKRAALTASAGPMHPEQTLSGTAQFPRSACHREASTTLGLPSSPEDKEWQAQGQVTLSWAPVGSAKSQSL